MAAAVFASAPWCAGAHAHEHACRPEQTVVVQRVLKLVTRQRGHNALLGRLLLQFPPSQLCQRVFVELGAKDGLRSNGRVLEQLGWRGHCIEANMQSFAALNASRPGCHNHNAVVWPRGEPLVYRSVPAPNHGLSGIKHLWSAESWQARLGDHVPYKDERVLGRPLRELLGGEYAIDAFLLDVGDEVLAFLRVYPWEIAVQTWAIKSNKINRTALVDLMLDHGFACHHYHADTLCGQLPPDMQPSAKEFRVP